ncbi:MAG: hypothetical protein IKL65_01755 [Bacilli bacterium]|nr:hypothetical protein [Bacilli bacterium]
MKDDMNNIDKEFTDINEESKYKNYVIVIILYIIVILLTILLIIGIKNQKDVIETNIDKDTTNSEMKEQTNDKNDVSENKDQEIEIPKKENQIEQENDGEENINEDVGNETTEDTNNINEFNILDQL